MTLVVKHNRSKIILTLVLYLYFKQFFQKKHDINYSKMRRDNALKRRIKIRLTWSEVNARISDAHFRRMFRMSRPCFQLICSTIIRSIGERSFKSQAYIDAFLSEVNVIPSSLYNIYKVHEKTSGGVVSGEVKLAITIRILAGGSALDLAVLFEVSEAHCKRLFIDVLKNWIIKTNIGQMDIGKYLKDDMAMK